MRLPFLIHLLDAVSSLARPRRVIVMGSSSLLPGHPELGDTGQPLELSLDADLLLEPIDESLAKLLKEAVGHESALRAAARLLRRYPPPRDRGNAARRMGNAIARGCGYDHVFALDAYDLGLVKLVVGREKDLDLLRTLLRLGILEPTRLRQHYQGAPLGEREAVTAGRNLQLLLKELE